MKFVKPCKLIYSFFLKLQKENKVAHTNCHESKWKKKTYKIRLVLSFLLVGGEGEGGGWVYSQGKSISYLLHKL
jgi:hypothetical protein